MVKSREYGEITRILEGGNAEESLLIAFTEMYVVLYIIIIVAVKML